MDRTIYFKIYLTTERSYRVWFRATGCVKINFKIRPKKSVSTWEFSHYDAENWWFMSYVGNSVISEGIATCYYLPYMQDSLQAPEINLMEYVSFKQIPSWKVVLFSSQIKQASHSFFYISFSGSLLMDSLFEMHSVVLQNLQLLHSSSQFSSQAYKKSYLNYLAKKYDIQIGRAHV